MCVNGASSYMFIELGGYLVILGATSVQSCCTVSISGSYHVLVYGRYRKSRCGCVSLSDLDLSRHHPFYEEQCQRVCMTGFPPKMVNRAPITEVGGLDTICQSHLESSTACMLCRLEQLL